MEHANTIHPLSAGTSTAGGPAATGRTCGPDPSTPRYRWRLLRPGPLWLDGGSMFGVVPRALWSRLVAADEQGRIRLAHNCLLLEPAEPATPTAVHREVPRRIVIETGSGDHHDEKMRRMFGLEQTSIADSLAQIGARCEDVSHVIVSHLHFDHAGGLVRRPRAGETPDWAGPDSSGPSHEHGVKLTFPAAQLLVQRREWLDALAGRSVMTRTYLRRHLEPLRERLRMVEAPPPFPPGYLPERRELPSVPLARRQIEVLPGVWVFLVPGHTWGQQAIRFVDDQGRNVVFTPDVLPTACHYGAAYNMAYDVEPYTSTVTRHWFLRAAAENSWLLALDHEPDHPLQRVTPDGKGWYQLSPCEQ